jgi:hypothetical protein
MIVWRGWGILVVVLAAVPLLVVQLAVDVVLGHGYYVSHGWPKFVALAQAAMLVWMFARVLDSRPGRVVVDQQTGQQLTLGGGDHLFFLPVRYWPALLLLAGIGFGFFGPTSLAFSAPQASVSPSPERASESARPAPMTAVPQQVRASLAEATGDLSGRWDGTPGRDGIREVLVIESEDAERFAGRSFFEDSRGEALPGQGTITGTLSDGQVTFTISRDGHEFVWTGSRTDSGRTLTGQLEGYSNDATYRRQ